MYYDKTNGNLYLYVNSDNSFKMTDDNDNEFYFDTNGRLVRMVSNTNNNIEKKIKYENNINKCEYLPTG